VFDRLQLEEWVKALRQQHAAVNHRTHPYEVSMYYDA
jgi:glutamine synthetase